MGDVQEHTRPIFRFYFEGLVAHIHLDAEYESDKLGPLVLGQKESITITTVTYEQSFQRKNLMNITAQNRWRLAHSVDWGNDAYTGAAFND